ncbi:MAG TPA: glycosyltransferase family 4 protein [Chloroflexota bacterium]|nr:glycosyltransferase family 4 protein [Chloroflexota bacterium]
MKIAIISTPHIPTPPAGYGASERVAGALAEGLQRRGHHVRLFACEGSTARVAECRTYANSRLGQTFDQSELIHVGHAIREVTDCDVIHNHCLAAGPAFAGLVDRPFLTTLHYVHPLVRANPTGPYVAISEQQRRSLRELTFAGRVYNGIDVEDLPLCERHDDYLLFLGRFHPNKGADLAIEVAKRSGRRLILAAPAPPADQVAWFDLNIRPRLDTRIEWIGPVEGKAKAQLLGGAAATLLPLRWDEPFGLVIAESMACGTPPIAFRRGAAPEIISDGTTGFLVDDLEGMIAAVERVSQISPIACRARVEDCFSVERMIDGYLAMYHRHSIRSSAS